MEFEVTRENSQQQEERKRRMLPLMETVGSYGANGYYLTKDGKPWYPVMGEIHFSRVPSFQWESSLIWNWGKNTGGWFTGRRRAFSTTREAPLWAFRLKMSMDTAEACRGRPEENTCVR